MRRVHQLGGKVVGGTDPVLADVLPGYGMHLQADWIYDEFVETLFASKD